MINDPALDASIEHWWKNAELHDRGLDYDIYAKDCALCQQRYTCNPPSVKCDGIGTADVEMCPIMAHTGFPGCKGTPWTEVLRRAVHPWVMAKWLEDLRAERNPPVYPSPWIIG